MKIEYLVFFYMLVCVMMTLFNFGFLFYEKAHSKRFERKMARMAVELEGEIDRNADFPTEAHRHVLERRMRRLSGMEAFDLSMDKLRELDAGKSERYLHGIAQVFEHLTYEFARKDDLKCAYFACIIGKWYRKRPAASVVTDALLHYVRERSFYARQNALMALSAIADERTLVDAAIALDEIDSFHHPKLVTEAFLAYAGDRAALSREAVARFGDLQPSSQVAVVNFARMYRAEEGTALTDEELTERQAWVFEVLCDERADLEVRLACVRYFMRWPWQPAADKLRELALRDAPETWEFAAVAASALASYPGEETVAVLKRCLRSSMWHVRANAAKSLYDLGLSRDDLADVLEGGDPYAADMVRYRWSLEEAHEGGASR